MKRILCLSDMHVGSQYAVMPDVAVVSDPQSGDDREIQASFNQRKLLELWNSMLDTVGHVDICIVNGDTCDGAQPKEFAQTLWTSDLKGQVDSAVQLLKTVKADRFMGTLGSGYHTQIQRPLDQAVMEALGGEFGNELLIDLKKENVRLHVQHFVGVSTSSWQYRTTSLARDMVLMYLNQSAEKYGKCQWVIRGHAHYFVGALYSTQSGIVLPCWKLKDPYAVKKGLLTPPDIGWVLLEVDDNGKVDMTHDIRSVSKPCKVVSG